MPHTTDNPQIASYDDTIAYLLGRIDYERTFRIPYRQRNFRLDRMRRLMERLGSPHERLKIVHIAGTKGKGSTGAMLAAVLAAAGIKTGVYSSPHLYRLEERLTTGGSPCTPDELVDLVRRIRPVVAAVDAEMAPEDGELTYFELTTALAFMHFAERAVDLAVFEVGMGGRLDATNVCRPILSVITSISFDHTRQLGNTLREIAVEKAGIIKPGVPVVCGVRRDEPRTAIEEIARRNAVRVIQAGVDFDFSYTAPPAGEPAESAGRFDFSFDSHNGDPVHARYEGLTLGMLGRHQGANASVALATLPVLAQHGFHVPPAAVREGLAQARCCARIEVVQRAPTIIVDAAHNVASIQALLDTLSTSFGAGKRTLIFATSRDKDLRGMLAILLPRFDEVILTRYENNPRSVRPAVLAEIAAELSVADIAAESGGSKCRVCPNPASAWESARSAVSPDDLICVTGSFFIAAEMRRQIITAPPVAVVPSTV